MWIMYLVLDGNTFVLLTFKQFTFCMLCSNTSDLLVLCRIKTCISHNKPFEPLFGGADSKKFNFERVSIFAHYCLCVFEYFCVFLLTYEGKKEMGK